MIEAVGAAYARGSMNTQTFETRLDLALTARTRTELRWAEWDIDTRVRARRFAWRWRARVDRIAWPTAAPLTIREVDVRTLPPGTTWTIGRSRQCDVVLRDHPTVSARHLELSVRDGWWHLRDMASKNGTFIGRTRVNDVPIDPAVPVTVGDVELRFRGV